ncbi:hypothetical protein KP003_02935 [Geomonas nitrogeniifigens]|uniref:hypothetical protein n=1 Tax=Geomonas diazotrophica TaxID=2843197 RepID=UPI001C2BA3D6|nr:hypothetical protein [Geomonas nitrogeniifigens]QXE87380.1 hypothetical protein KP003_02935 [Geomonas nitrogeniifigens]
MLFKKSLREVINTKGDFMDPEGEVEGVVVGDWEQQEESQGEAAIESPPLSTPPRRRGILTNGAVKTPGAPSLVSQQPTTQLLPAAPPNPTGNSDRIALVAKIDKGLHSKLKVYSLYTKQSIVDLVEAWIKESIPTVKVELTQ